MASLIRNLAHLEWTALKITQFGHGFCTADGEACDCQTDEHTVAISQERPETPGYDPTTDSARYVQAGAVRSIWVRTRMGNLATAMPRIRKEIAAAKNTIIESNSIMGLMRPDLYLSVLDYGTADFKETARLFLNRADALLVREDSQHLQQQWQRVSPRLMEDVPCFSIRPPDYMSLQVVAFVEERLRRIVNEEGMVQASTSRPAV